MYSRLAWLALLFCGSVLAQPAATRGALDRARLGLYEGADFPLVDGPCADCATIAQALWYFRGDLVAVPRRSAPGSQWKIVPVAPRPFPAEMRGPEAPGDPARASSYAVGAYAAVVLLGVAWAWRRGAGKRGGRQGQGL